MKAQMKNILHFSDALTDFPTLPLVDKQLQVIYCTSRINLFWLQMLIVAIIIDALRTT